MSDFSILIVIIAVILIIYFPNIWAKMVSAIILIIQLMLMITVEDALIETGIDTTVDVLEQFDLINIPDSFCPGRFNRTDYCVNFGLEKGELNGQVFLTGELNDYVDIRFETKQKTFSCPLKRGKACSFAQIKSAKDLKISLTDKRGTTILTNFDLIKDLKRYTKALRFVKYGKILNKLIP